MLLFEHAVNYFLRMKTGHKVRSVARHRADQLAITGFQSLHRSLTNSQVLLSSHRNSVAGHTDLIKQTDCGVLLYTAGFPVSGILEASKMVRI